jgi:selenocysteine lyase/cysteine desulfurase
VVAEPLAPLRDAFDIPPDVAYLNCAYFSPKPDVVLEAGRRALDAHTSPWLVGPPDFFEPAERLRDEFARLIGGDADGVAFVPSVSYGVGVAARNLEVGPGRTVVTVEEQFPSDLYPWRRLVAERGGEIVTVALQGSGAWTQSVLDAIDDRTAVVVAPNVHWTDGRLFDLVAIGTRAREVGAALVVDGSQSIAAAPFDVSVVQPDFLISVGYKWQFGPYGYCYLWAAAQHREGTPIEDTWIGRKGSADFSRLVDYTDEFQPGARRYDVGEFSNFLLVPMARAALEFVNGLGPDRIAATIEPLTAAIEEGTRDLGLVPVARSDRLSHLLGVRFPSGLPDGLRERLAEDRVHVSIRGSAVRIAPHVYNTMDDVDRLLKAFRAVV